MALLGTIPANSTGTINLNYVPEKLLITNQATGVQSFADVSSISIVNSGRQVATLTGKRVSGFARVAKYITGAAQLLAESLQLGGGKNSGATTITITNTSANVLNVFGVSASFSNVIANYVETSINANANQMFTDFSSLLLSAPVNVERVNITFSNGFNDDFTVSELRALVGEVQNTNNNAELDGNLLVPNFAFGENQMQSAIVFVNSSGACVVGVQRFVEQ